jgi:type I site-specific restriction endonuclease
MQQALDYATALQVPFVFSSNGKAFVLHDRTGLVVTGEAGTHRRRLLQALLHEALEPAEALGASA